MVLSSSRSPNPTPSLLSVRTHTHASPALFFSHPSFFSFHLLPIPSLSFHLSFLSPSLLFFPLPLPFSYPPSLPSFLLPIFLSFLPSSFLRRKASLSVFTADLDLNVHTIKARGECQEWGCLSTLGPRGPATEGSTQHNALCRFQCCSCRRPQ